MSVEMKESGTLYAGQMPKTWKAVPIKFIAKCNTDSLSEGTDPSYEFRYVEIGSVSHENGIESYENTLFKDAPSRARRIVHRGDVIISTVRTYLKAVASIEDDDNVIVSTGFAVLTPVDIDSKYFAYYLSSEPFVEEVSCNSYGLSYPAINSSDLVRLKICCPPIEEQRIIAKYLDTECGKIDSAIQKHTEATDKLLDLRLSIIINSTRKGVRRGHCPLKKTGNFWFPEIPESWTLSRIGLCFDVTLGKMLCTSPEDDTYTLEAYYCAGDVHFDGVTTEGNKQMWFSPSEKKTLSVRNGDVLVVEGGAGAGNTAIVQGQSKETFIQNSILRLRPNKHGMSNEYVRYLLEGLVKLGYIEVACNTATFTHFTKDKVRQVPIPIMPGDEQVEIAEYINGKCSKIEHIIKKHEDIVNALREYKKSLIYYAVTGKIDCTGTRN